MALKGLALPLLLLTSCASRAPREVEVDGKVYVEEPSRWFGTHLVEKLSTWDQFIVDMKEPLTQLQMYSLYFGAAMIVLALVVSTPIVTRYARRAGVASGIIWGLSLVMLMALSYLWLLVIPAVAALILIILNETQDWSLFKTMKAKYVNQD